MPSNDKSVTNQAQTKKHVSNLIKPVKFVSAGTFDLNSSLGNQSNSKIKSLSDLKTGSGPKTYVVKRFESKKVTKKDGSESKQTPSPKTQTSSIKTKSQTKSPKKNQINFKNLMIQHPKLITDCSKDIVRSVTVITMILLNAFLTGIVTSVTKGIILQRNVIISNFVIFVSDVTMIRQIVSLENPHQ